MINKLKIFIRKLLLRKSTMSLYKKLRHIKVNVMRILSDEQFVKLNVYFNTGIKINLENPKMYVEKLNWLKLNYRNPLQTSYTDKYQMRTNLIAKGYEYILPPLIGVYEKFEDIQFSRMPSKVFVKTNHSSGMNQVITRSSTDLDKAKHNFNKSLKQNYYKFSREWNYKNIKPKLLVEHYLDMSEYLDYKFFVFNGKVEFFAVIKDIIDETGNQSLESQFNLYDLDLKPLNVDVKRKTFDDTNFEFSPFIKEMIDISEDLASPFPFVRVDFLVSQSKFLFGEMTFHPNGGELVFYPLSKDYEYGKKINLNNIPNQFIKKRD
ncbi:teichuronopeptide biosynthesis TupA-like protein [Staphylococcus warneri]|nr:hypothetical protein JX000_00440 [Staphylococcus sp. SB1-57]HBY83938.1 hypothetical protein [Staphylococcus sp.]